MNAFQQYLAFHEIDPVRLSIAARVRYIVIWNAQKGNPITPEHAQKMQQALLTLTGTPYTGTFTMIPTNHMTMQTNQATLRACAMRNVFHARTRKCE